MGVASGGRGQSGSVLLRRGHSKVSDRALHEGRARLEPPHRSAPSARLGSCSRSTHWPSSNSATAARELLSGALKHWMARSA